MKNTYLTFYNIQYQKNKFVLYNLIKNKVNHWMAKYVDTKVGGLGVLRITCLGDLEKSLELVSGRLKNQTIRMAADGT